MTKLSIQDVSLKDKKVIMRVDFNVPMDENQHITDDTRIKAALPSIEYILNQGASLILLSHLGRPKGQKIPKLSLAPTGKRLSELIKKPVIMARDCIGPSVEKAVEDLTPGSILLLENVRFYAAEEHPDKDPSFAKRLASYGEIYVNDAFSVSHRAHSSVTTITQYFPQKALVGFLLDKEIAFLETILHNPKRPFYALLGGAKISTKIGVIKNLIPRLDALFIGGGMAYTFLRAQGYEIGSSIKEENLLDETKAIIDTCNQRAVKLFLPLDIVIASHFSRDAEKKTITIKEGIPPGWQGMDIGDKTIEEWSSFLKQASTVFWNGPLGVFEFPPFSHGTNSIAKILSTLNATTVVGGGDSIAAIVKAHLFDKFTHLCTGGGASLEFLEYGHLPGIDSLCNR